MIANSPEIALMRARIEQQERLLAQRRATRMATQQLVLRFRAAEPTRPLAPYERRLAVASTRVALIAAECQNWVAGTLGTNVG